MKNFDENNEAAENDARQDIIIEHASPLLDFFIATSEDDYIYRRLAVFDALDEYEIRGLKHEAITVALDLRNLLDKYIANYDVEEVKYIK